MNYLAAELTRYLLRNYSYLYEASFGELYP